MENATVKRDTLSLETTKNKSPAEQCAVAGVITSANGISYVLAPGLGIGLYGWHHESPFAAFAALLVLLAIVGRRRLAD